MRFDIPESELHWRFDTSGGPGGQHANRSNTRVELTFDIVTSTVFTEAIRTRIMGNVGQSIKIVDDGSRSQATNRKRALRRLHAALDNAARPSPPPRQKTRPSLSARRRRLAAKRVRGQTKQERRRPTAEE